MTWKWETVGEKTLEASLFGQISTLRSLPARRWQLEHLSLSLFFPDRVVLLAVFKSFLYFSNIGLSFSSSRCENCVRIRFFALQTTFITSLTTAERKHVNSKCWIHPRKCRNGAGIDLWTSEGGLWAQQAHILVHKHHTVVHCLDLTFRIDRVWSILQAPLTAHTPAPVKMMPVAQMEIWNAIKKR